MDIAFTAGMEAKLDLVEEGGVDWKKALKEFYTPFKDKIAEAAVSIIHSSSLRILEVLNDRLKH